MIALAGVGEVAQRSRHLGHRLRPPLQVRYMSERDGLDLGAGSTAIRPKPQEFTNLLD